MYGRVSVKILGVYDDIENKQKLIKFKINFWTNFEMIPEVNIDSIPERMESVEKLNA